jgi:acetyl esterase
MASATISDRVQAAVARGLLGLPHGVMRLLVGRPIEVDGEQLNVESQLGLKLIALAGEPDLALLTPGMARDRVARDAATFAGRPIELARVEELSLDGGAGKLRGRLYIPRDAPDPGGMLVFFHGGGFVVGDLDTHDNSCRFLARQAGVRVLAVEYRLAPEHRFPAAIDDALAAFRSAAAQASKLGADPTRLAVGGDSAGGNLAAAVAQLAAHEGGPAPVFQLLFYPWLDLSSKRDSYRLFRDGFYLTEADLDWYRDHYLSSDDDARDPRCSPLLTDRLAGVAPAYIATAGFDPLRDDGEEYAARLREAGVSAALRRHRGMFHGFYNTVAVGTIGREAILEAAGALRLGLATAGAASAASAGAGRRSAARTAGPKAKAAATAKATAKTAVKTVAVKGNGGTRAPARASSASAAKPGAKARPAAKPGATAASAAKPGAKARPAAKPGA